jgi:uncharacterized damage-inducible protein DinB
MNNLIHHVRYNRWATARTLRSAGVINHEEQIRDLGASYGSVRGTLVHIYQADRIWWDRLMEQPTLPLEKYEPPAERAVWEREWTALLDRYVAWAEGFTDADWNRVIAYRDTKGNPYESPVWQILLHLTNHDSYHRGQVASLLRQLGHAPLGTDLILYYRELASA